MEVTLDSTMPIAGLPGARRAGERARRVADVVVQNRRFRLDRSRQPRDRCEGHEYVHDLIRDLTSDGFAGPLFLTVWVGLIVLNRFESRAGLL